MLTIYLHRSQANLLTELAALFPDLEETHSFYPNHRVYHAYLSEGSKQAQKDWLYSHLVLFVDSERIRERRARVFFEEITLTKDGCAPDIFSFERVDNDPDYHRVLFRAKHEEIVFYLLAGWTGRERVSYSNWSGGLYVHQESDRWLIHVLNDHGCLGHEVYRASTPQEIEYWLLCRRYLQVYCLSSEPNVCGLYRCLREAAGADMWPAYD